MDRNVPTREPFECVEPELGVHLPLLDAPELDPELRDRLRDHLAICDACRLEREIETRVQKGLRSEALSLGPAGGGRWSRFRPPILTSVGGGALAAAVVLALFLPPSVPTNGETVRRDGDAGPRFVRPVEGEVVATATPRLSWTPLTGATAYTVEITQIGGDFRWIGRSDETALQIPAAAGLPEAGRFRAVLRPVPADLAGVAAASTSFVRGDWLTFVRYRIGAAPPAVWLVAGAGILLLMLALVQGFFTPVRS